VTGVQRCSSDLSDPEAVRLAHVAGLTISPGEALLFRTRNSEPAQHEAHPDHVYLTPEVADHCVAHGVRLVGVDCHAPERPGEAVEAAPIHRRLLGNGVLILEGLNLRGVPPGRYVLLCLPLNIPGAEGSPVRAVLLA
jgi:arylformamidase